MPKAVEVLKSQIGAHSSTSKANRPPPPRPKSKKTPSSRSSTPTPATTKPLESSESAAAMLPSSSSKMAGSSTLKDRLLTETIVSIEKTISSTEAKIMDVGHDDDAMPSLPQCASMELLAHCEAASQSSSHGSLAKTPPKSPETSRTPPSDSVLPRLSAEQVRKLTPPRAAATLNEDASQVRTTTSASPARSNPYRSTSGGRTFERPLSELRSKSTTASSRATTTASAAASASASATATAAPSSSDGDTTSASPIASNSMKAAAAASSPATASAPAKGKQKKGKKAKHATDAEPSNVVAASSSAGAVLTSTPATSDAATAAAVPEAKKEEPARPAGPGPSHFEPSQSRQQHCGLGGASTAAVDGSAPDSSIDPLFSPYSSRFMAYNDHADGAAPPMSMPYQHYHQQMGFGTMGEGHDDLDDCEPVPRPYSSARPSIAVVDGDATAPSAAPLVSMTQAYANAAVTSTASTGNENALSEFDQHQQQLSAFGGYSLYEYQHQQFTQAYGYDWNDEALGGQYSSSVTNPPGTLTTSADVVQGSITGAMPTGKDMLVCTNDDDDAVPALESLTLPEAATVTSTMNDNDRPFQQNDKEPKQSADGHDEEDVDVDATDHCGPSPSATATAAAEEEETTVPHNHQGPSSEEATVANALPDTAEDDETELQPGRGGQQEHHQSMEAEGLTLGDLDPEPLESAAADGNSDNQLQETSASVTEATQQSSSDALFDGSVGVSRGLARLGCSPAHPWAMDTHQHYHGHYQPHYQHQPQEFYGGHYHPSMQHHQQYYEQGQHYGHHDASSALDQTASAQQAVEQGAAAEAIRDDDEPVEVTKVEDVEPKDEPKPAMPTGASASTASCSIATPPHVSDARSTSPSVCSSSGVHGGAHGHGHGHGHGGHTTPPYYGGLKSYPTCKHAQATLRARYHRQMQQHHHTQQQQHQAVYGQCNPLPCSRSRSCASSSTPRHSHSGVPSCEHSRSVSGRQSPAMSPVSATVSDLHMHQHHQHQSHHDPQQNAPVDASSSAHTSAENVAAADSLALAGAGVTKPASTAVDALVETFADGVDAARAAASAEHDVQTSPRHNGTDTARVATSGPAGDFYGHMLPNHHHHLTTTTTTTTTTSDVFVAPGATGAAAAVVSAIGGDASTTGTPSMVATPSVGPPALLDDAMTAPYVSTTASAALRHATLVSDAAVFSNASMDQSMSSPITAQAVFDNAVMDAESSMLYSATNADGSALTGSGAGAGVGPGGASSMMFTPFFTSEGFSNDAAAAAMGEVSGAVDGTGAAPAEVPPPAAAPSPFAAASFLEAMGVVVPKGASAAATAVKASPTPGDADVSDSALKVEATAEKSEELKPAVSEEKTAAVTPEVSTPAATVRETAAETTTVALSKRKIPMPKSAAARLRASASSTPEPQQVDGDLKMAPVTTTTIVAGRRRVVTPTSPVAEGSGYPAAATSGPRGYVQMSYPQATAQPSTTAYDHQETRNAQPISTGDAQVDSQPQPQSWSQAQLPPPPPYHALEGHSGTPSLSASVGAVREDSRSPGAQSGDLHSDYHLHHEHLQHHPNMHHPHDHQAGAHAHDHDLHGHEVYAAHDGHHVPEDTSHHEYVTAGVYSSKRTSLQFSPATPAAIDFPLHADHSDVGLQHLHTSAAPHHDDQVPSSGGGVTAGPVPTENVIHAGDAATEKENEQREEGNDAAGPGPYRSVALDRRAAESPPPASDVSSCSARCYVSSTGQHHHDHAHVQLNVASSTGHFGAAGITGAGAYPHQFHHGQEGHAHNVERAHDHAQGYLQAQEYDPTTSPAEMGMMHMHHQHHRFSLDANGTPTPEMEVDMASGGLSPCGNSVGFAAADNGAGGAVSAGSETPEQVQGEYLPLEFYCADGTFDFDAEFEVKKNLGEPPSYEEGVECLKAAGRLVPLPPTEAELELEAQNARRAKRAAARKLQRQKRQERKREDAAAAKETKEEKIKSSVVRAFGRLQRSDDDDDEASSDFDDVSGSVSFGSRTPTTVTPTSPAPIQSHNSFGARSNISVVSSAAGGGKKTVALPQPKSSKAKGASPAASPISSTVVPPGAIPKSKSQSAKPESQIADSSSKRGGEKNDGKKDEKTQQKGLKPTGTTAGRGGSASGGSVLSASFHSAARDKTWASWSSSSAASSADDCDDSLDTFGGGDASPSASASATASAFVAASAPVVVKKSAEGKAASNDTTGGGQQRRTAATQAATATATAVVSSGSGKMSGSFDRVSSTGEFPAASDANAPTRASGGAAALPSLTTISFDDDEGLEWQSQRSQTPNSTTAPSGATRRGFTAKASSQASPSAAKMPPRASTVSWALMSEGNNEEDEAYQHELATMQAIRQEQLEREAANAARRNDEANAARSTPATTPTTKSSTSASSRTAAVAEPKSALPPASAAAPGSFAAALLAGASAATPAASSAGPAKPFSATQTSTTSTASVSPPRAAAAPRQDGKGPDGKKSPSTGVASGFKSGGSKKVAASSSTSKMGGKDAVSTAAQSSAKPKPKGKFADIPAGSDSRAIFGEGRPQSKKELMVKEKKELMLREKKELMVKEKKELMLREKKELMVKEKKELMLREKKELMVKEKKELMLREKKELMLKQKKELMLKEKKDTTAKKSETTAAESEVASKKEHTESSKVEQTGVMNVNDQTTTTPAAEAVAASDGMEGSGNGVCSDLHSAPPSPPSAAAATDAATDAVPDQRTTTADSPPLSSVLAGQEDEMVQEVVGEEDQDRQESKESTSAAAAPATAPVAPKKKPTGGATSLKAAMAELERQEAAAAAAAAAKKAKKKAASSAGADQSSSIPSKKEKSQPSTKSESVKTSKGQSKSAAKSVAKGSGGKGKGGDEFDSMLAELVKATATKKPNGGAGGSSSAPLTGAHHQGAAAEIVDGQAPGVRADHNAPEFYLSQATACHCQSLACPISSDETAPVLTSTTTGAVTSCVDDCTPGPGAPASALGPRTKALLSALNVRISTISKSPLPRNVHVFVHHFRRAESDLAQKNPNGRVYALHEADKVLQHYALPPIAEALFKHELAEANHDVSDYDAAKMYADECIEIAKEVGAPAQKLQLSALIIAGRSCESLVRPDGARAYAEDAMVLARKTKDLVGETWALSVGALAMELLARFDDCLFLQSRAAALASIAQNERLKFEVGMAAAIADLSAGRYHASVKKFMLMREASSFQTFVDPTAQSRIIGNLGHALSFVDELDEAAAVLNAEAVRAESAGDPFTALTNLSQLGSTLRCGGRIVEATDAHERELRLALRHPQFGRVGEAHGSLAICHRRTGDLQAAKASHERELQAARRSMDTLLETKALVGLAVVALEMHELEPSAAVESLASSLALLERVPDEDRCRYAVKLGCCEIEVRAHEAIEQALLRGNDSEAAMRAMDRRHLPLLTNWLRRVVAVSKLPTGVENAVLTHPQFVVADSDSNGMTCTGGDCQCSHDHGVTNHPEEEKVLNDVAPVKKANKEGTKQPSQAPGKTKMLKGQKGTTTALPLPQKSSAASAPEASAEKAAAPFPTPPLLTPSMGPASISALACMTNAVMTTPVPAVLERCDIDLAVSFSLPWDSAESMRVYVARKDTSEVTSRVVPLSRKFLALIAATSSKFRQRLAANTGDPPLLPPSYSQLAEVAAKENGDFLSSGVSSADEVSAADNVSPDEATTNESTNSIEEAEKKRLHPMRPEWAYELHRQIIAPIEDLLLLPSSRAAAEADPSGVPIICFIADGLMANVPFPMLTPAHDAPCLIELCAVTTSPSLEALSLLGELNDSVKKLQSALDTKVHQRANASNANASGMGSNTQSSEVSQPTNSTSAARPAKSVAVRWRSSVPLLAAADASVTASAEEKAAEGTTETTTTATTTTKETMSHECVLVDDSVAGLHALPDAADDSFEMSQARTVMKQNLNARFDSALRSLQPSSVPADLSSKDAEEKKMDSASSVPMKAKLLPSIDVQQRALIKALIGSLDERTAFGELDMWPPPLHSSPTGDVSATGDSNHKGEMRADVASTVPADVSVSRVPGSLPMSLLPAPTPCGSVPPFVALCPPSSLANDVVVTVDIPTVPDMSEEFVGGLIVGVPAAGRHSASNTSASKPSPCSSSDCQVESQVTSSPTISEKLAIETSTPTVTTTNNNASASTNASGSDSATLLLHEGQPCDPLFDTLRSPTLHGELLLLATPPAALAHRACVFLPRAQLSQRVLHESAATLPRVVLGLGAPRVVGLLWGADEAQLKEPLMPQTVEMVPNAIDQNVPTADEEDPQATRSSVIDNSDKSSDDVKTRALWAEISAGRWIAGEDEERRKEGRATAARGLRRVILRAMDGGTPHWGAVILSGLA